MTASAVLRPPVKPQLARSRRELPTGPDIVYEPKLDGYRAIAFVAGSELELQSRSGRPLRRYFPEIALPEGDYVVDGEIVVPGPDGREDFGLLSQRIHPAASRVAELSQRTPAALIAFDLLAEDGRSLLDVPFAERRSRLEARAAQGDLTLTPLSAEVADAEAWLRDREGVVAKERQAPYLPGERKGMYKVKRARTAMCVVMGWRPGKEEGTVGSLILGLHDEEGRLVPAGHCSGFGARQRRELPALLGPYETGERGSAAPSRWAAGRELPWVALRPELVGEFAFDHASGGRIRHGARFVAWRPEAAPTDCRLDQLSGPKP